MINAYIKCGAYTLRSGIPSFRFFLLKTIFACQSHDQIPFTDAKCKAILCRIPIDWAILQKTVMAYWILEWKSICAIRMKHSRMSFSFLVNSRCQITISSHFDWITRQFAISHLHTRTGYCIIALSRCNVHSACSPLATHSLRGCWPSRHR